MLFRLVDINILLEAGVLFNYRTQLEVHQNQLSYGWCNRRSFVKYRF